jgi:hypothetical protein
MKKTFTLASLVMAGAIASHAQISLTGNSPSYTQDFNTLASSGTANTAVPAGWAFAEAGNNANGEYRAADGSGNTGDTYSYGAASASERAFGGLASNNLTTNIGASFVNNTGVEINSFTLSYFGEQWRRGNTTPGKQDSLLFSYSTNATSLTDNGATWVPVNALSFFSINTQGTASALDGNLSVNRQNINHTVSISLQSGSTLWIRWTDINILGSDDGLSIDDLEIYFTTQGGGTPDTLVRFNPIAGSVAENAGTYNMNVVYNPTSPSTSFTAQVVLKSGNAADIGNYTTQTATFNAGANSTTVPVTITDNVLEDGNKTFVFALRNPSSGMLIGNDSLFTLTVTDNDAPVTGPPVYTIAQVRGANANGGPDSLNVTCELRGTVYGINYRPGGLEFTINDGTAGISVFAPVNANTFGYTVTEGDSIRVWGDITTFRGLAQIAFLDTIIPAGQGNLRNPLWVTALNESTESSLIRLNNCTLVNPSQWNPGGNSFNVDCNCTGGTFKLRIHSATTAINANAPVGNFDVIGIGSQFASTTSPPFNDGYQIIPRRLEDILYGGSIGENDASAALNIYPNPSDGIYTVAFDSKESGMAEISMMDIHGKTILTKNRMLTAGMNYIGMDENVAPGAYMIHISVNGFRAVQRVMIK